LIGEGKTVHCQNCGNSWHQKPMQVRNPYDHRPLVSSPDHSKAQSVLAMSSEDANDIISDKNPFDKKDPETDAELGSEGDTLSSELLDDMFGEDMDSDSFFTDDEPLPDDEDDEKTPEDLEDPEPIPGVFTNQDDEEDEEENKIKVKRKKIGIAAIGLVIILSGALFFSRSYIMNLFGSSEIGEGLDIQNVKSVRKDEKGIDILLVRGVVANTSKEERKVPLIKVVLYDSTEKEVEKTIVTPLKNILKAGAKIRFSAKLKKPSSLARRMEVTFTKANNQ